MLNLLSTFLKYCGAGGVATICHYLIFFSAVINLHWAPWQATILGASIGALVGYYLNYRFTFINNIAHKKTLPRFIIVASSGIMVQALTMLLLTTRWQFHYLFAQLMATAISLILTFFFNRFWTFK